MADIVEFMEKMKTIQGRKGGCFLGGTMIKMSNGSSKPIEDIQPDDLVISYDWAGNLAILPVTKTWQHVDQAVVTYKYWGGEINCTPNHWVLNQFNTFAEIGRLELGEDALVDENGHLRPLISSEPFGDLYTVYNLQVDEFHTFIADGIRVHNGGLGTGKVDAFIYGEKGGGGKGGWCCSTCC